jgi:hypothetical protein
MEPVMMTIGLLAGETNGPIVGTAVANSARGAVLRGQYAGPGRSFVAG